MYRQILVDLSDQSYQQILWRYDDKDPIQVYKLNTVTYGTRCAPYLATRCLKQLAIENRILYPRTSKLIETCFYMDDLILSVNSIDEAKEIFEDISKILSSAGFDLRKWSSNESSILKYIEQRSKLKDDKLIIPYENKELKTLGIEGNPNLDSLKYSINLNNNFSTVTKRSILIGPALIKAKILMQQLWQLQLNWDQPVPDHIKEFWLKFLSQIPILNKIQIKRQVL